MEDNKEKDLLEKDTEKEENEKDVNSNGLEDIEKDKENVEEKFGIDANFETIKEAPTVNDDRNYKIEVRLQELEVLLDDLDMKLQLDDDNYATYYEEYDKAKKEMNSLLKEKKAIEKEERSKEKKTVLDNISIWVIVYGIAQVVICLPGLSYSIWIKFASWLINLFSGTLNKITTSDFLYYPLMALLIYAVPLLLNLLTLELFINFIKPKNNKTNKITFIVFWIIQGCLTIFMMIYLGIQIFGD